MPQTKKMNQKQPAIHKTAYIHKSATVIGDVTIGEHSSIWPSAVLRGDTNKIQIGKYVNIQDNCTIHVDSSQGIQIGNYCLIGHNAIIHSSTIGTACLIGIGAMILEGCSLGDGCMITAGCLIRGGTKIPPYAMVVSKGGETKIFENKSRYKLTIAGCLEYAATIQRHKKKKWGPYSTEDEKDFYRQAERLVVEIGLDHRSKNLQTE